MIRRKDIPARGTCVCQWPMEGRTAGWVCGHSSEWSTVGGSVVGDERGPVGDMWGVRTLFRCIRKHAVSYTHLRAHETVY